jgi:hypothetical protein
MTGQRRYWTIQRMPGFRASICAAHIDQQNEQMLVELTSLGLQQQEADGHLSTSAPLTNRLDSVLPIRGSRFSTSCGQWESTGSSRVSRIRQYAESWPVDELTDVDPSKHRLPAVPVGRCGTLQVTPSSTFRGDSCACAYLALTATVVDPNQADRAWTRVPACALMVARFVAALNNGMGKLTAQLDARHQNLSPRCEVALRSAAAETEHRSSRRPQDGLPRHHGRGIVLLLNPQPRKELEQKT